MAEPREHPADLTILALVEDHLEHGALLVLRADRDPLGLHLSFGESHALTELVEQFRRWHTGHLHEIFLLHSIPWMGQQVGEIAVVGDQDQPFAHPVEPADGKEPPLSRHEIDHPGPSSGVKVGRDRAHRFVEQVDDPLGIGQPFAIDADLLTPRIDLCPEGRDHATVHFDAAGRDQLLTGPPAAEPRGGQHLLEPLEAIV